MYSLKSKPECGFSLLEILIAFSIAALSLGILLNIFSSGLRRTLVAEEYQQAVVIAQAKLAAADVELEAGTEQGTEYEDKYSWQRKIELFLIDGVESDKLSVELYRITVYVEWTEGHNSRQFELTTLKLAKKHARKV